MARRPNLSAKQIDALRAIDAPTISNAVEAFDVRDPTAGYASLELRCMFPDLPPAVGFAITCTVDTTTPARQAAMGLGPLVRAIRAAPKPAIVVMKSVGQGRLRSCHLGDTFSTISQRLGAVAAVADAGARDLAGISERAPGFQVFAAGTVASRGTYRIVEIGGTVSVCGLTTAPGDLLHGDANGLISIPLTAAGRVASQAKKILAADAEFVDFLKAPRSRRASLSGATAPSGRDVKIGARQQKGATR